LPRFREAFDATFDAEANAAFLHRVVRYAERRKWTHLLHAFRVGVERVAKLAAEADDSLLREETATVDSSAATKTPKTGKTKKTGKKRSDAEDAETSAPSPKRRRRTLSSSLVETWRAFERDLTAAERAVQGSGDGPGVRVRGRRSGFGVEGGQVDFVRRNKPRAGGDAGTPRRYIRERGRVRGFDRARRRRARETPQKVPRVRRDEPRDGCRETRFATLVETQVHGSVRW
jgi:hypothetical protein